MTRKEAVIAMLDGKKIISIDFPNAYMYFTTNTGFRFVSNGIEEPLNRALSNYRDYQIKDNTEEIKKLEQEIKTLKKQIKELKL